VKEGPKETPGEPDYEQEELKFDQSEKEKEEEVENS
jgi:hypothetical protein